MKHISKLASVFCTAALAMTTLTGCEGSDIFGVNSPDWLSEKINDIANANKGDAPKISPTTLGKTDCTAEWWESHLDQDIKIESNKVYTTTFTNYSSLANNYNNYVVVLRKADKTEYCCLRSDDYGWGDSYASCTHSNTASDDWASWLAQMNGAKVTVTVTNYGDNTCDVVADVVGTEGMVSQQKYTGIPVESGDLYLDFTVDHCYYVFDKEEMDVTDAVDQQPVSMQLVNVPEEVNLGSELSDFTSQIKAQVTYDGGTVKDVASSDLSFMVVPDFNTLGEKYIVATLNKTLLNKQADKTINASAKFKVVDTPVKVELVSKPKHTNYYIYNSDALLGVERTLAFDTEGLEIKGTYQDGRTEILDNSKLTFSAIPATVGEHKVVITANGGKTVEVTIKVNESTVKAVKPEPASLGTADCTAAFFSVCTDDIQLPAGATREFNLTNYSSGAGNWNNYYVILRDAAKTAPEYAVVRADNYGWGSGYDACTHVGTQLEAYPNWEGWLATMNGAKVKVFVTNCNNGTADVQAIVTGTDGTTTYQRYTGINNINPSDLFVSFTVDSSHLVFE
ncbi:hypothetical protein [uncultured Prevotella sp.]|uniref:hypothetical protein n=1 Tax=uncultured Prevotella sp. TaxID=159272 RepID=UPI002622E107|nr:hypothetical protein [uncultured Prevotella sp.]